MLVLSAALVALYAPVLTAAPLAWDDPVWLEDPAANGDLGLAFTTARDGVYAPILRLAFGALITLGGSPLVLHGAVLGAFCLSLPLLLRVLADFGVPRLARAPALALWALSVQRVENLAWITGLKDTLSLLFLAGGAALIGPRRALGTGLVALALGTRSSTATVVMALAVITWSTHGRREALRRWGAALALAGVTIVIAQQAWVAGPGNAAFPEGSRLELGLMVLRKAIFAFQRPCAVYSVEGLEPGMALDVVILTSRGLLPAALWALGHRSGVAAWKAAAVVCGWWLCLLPFSGVVGMAFWAADRHALFADLIRIAAAFGAILSPGPARVVAGIGGLMLWSVALVPWHLPTSRIPDWQSDLALWTADAACPGDHWARRYNLGMAQAKDGQFDAAVESFRAGLALKPDHDGLLGRLIVAQLAASHWDAGAAKLAAIAVPPPDDAGWAVLAVGLVQHGDLELAGLAADRALRARRSPEALLVAARVALGRGEEAKMRALVAEIAAAIGKDPAEIEAKLRLVASP